MLNEHRNIVWSVNAGEMDRNARCDPNQVIKCSAESMREKLIGQFVCMTFDSFPSQLIGLDWAARRENPIKSAIACASCQFDS